MWYPVIQTRHHSFLSKLVGLAIMLFLLACIYVTMYVLLVSGKLGNNSLEAKLPTTIHEHKDVLKETTELAWDEAILSQEPVDKIRKLTVTAFAYNSFPSQTDNTPNIAAWGDKLEPGVKAIAVSRDLIELGLKRNTLVKIEGLEGVYRVLDKMHGRWKMKIDIYMGNDRRKALEWGKREVEISWNES